MHPGHPYVDQLSCNPGKSTKSGYLLLFVKELYDSDFGPWPLGRDKEKFRFLGGTNEE